MVAFRLQLLMISHVVVLEPWIHFHPGMQYPGVRVPLG
jgi:hypothetical protein